MVQHSNYWFSTAPTRHGVNAGLIKAVDVLIIGGGIAGISALYQLVANGINAYLIEESTVGFHASGRSSGQLMFCGSNLFSSLKEETGRAYLNFVYDNNKMLVNALRQAKFDTDLRECGGLRLAVNEDELLALQTESDFIFKHKKLSCPILSADEVNNILPSAGFVGGMFVPLDAIFNPYKIVNGFREALEVKGQRVLTGCLATKVVKNNDNTLSVHIRHKGVIRAKKVVYCSGAYVSELLSEFSGIITSHRNQMIATEILPEPVMRAFTQMSVSANHGHEYWRIHGGRILLGGMRHSVRGQQINIMDDGEISNTVYERLRAYFNERFPTLRDIKFSHTWSNIGTTTKDGLPLIGGLAHNENEIVFSACNYNNIVGGSLIVRDIVTKGGTMQNLFNPERAI